MKKSLLFMLLLILGISFGSNLFAQIPITIGSGTEVNTTTGAPAPYGTWYKAFRQQFLVQANEFYNAGAGPGDITSLSFNVSELNNCTAMNNYRIRLKHTTQTALSTTFETGDYQQVFQAASFMPVEGWNEHVFSAPFNWDGTSNLLVDIVTDVIDGSYAQNASVYYSTTTFNSALRYQNDTQNGDIGTTGTTGLARSNMKFTMQQLDMQDMAAIVITGPNSPSINSTINYTITVKSLCPDPVSDYTVKLMLAPDTMIASLPGTIINSLQELQFTMPWTPTEEGGFQLFGRVEMPGDENPNNNNTPMLDVTVIPEGLANVTIGDGTVTNTTTGVPTPYGTYYKNFRQQYLITASEINNEGGGPGEIYGISFNVDNLNNCGPMPNYRIRIKPTSQTVLTTTFEAGDYQQVFQAASFMPVVGWNFHPFSTPFDWDGASNLLIDILTDIAGAVGQNASVFYTNTGYNSALRYQSDSLPADGSATGTLAANRSNMILSMQQLDMQDMVGVSITGPTTPSVNSTVNYTVKVKNLSPNNVTDYTVKLMEGPNTLISSVPGTVIGPMAELEFVLPWTPSTVGITQLYGRVEMPGDENPANDNTPMMNVEVVQAGLLVVQLGEGTTTNTNTGPPTPYGTYYKAFRQQYLYRADEIFAVGGAPGLINAIAFNVMSVDECSPMPNYQIRLKHTQQTVLTTTFEVGDYHVGFHSDSYMPDNGWNLHTLSNPFFWNGTDNLLVDITTDVIAGTYTRNALVYYSTPGFNSSCRYQSDSANGSTGATGTVSLNRSNTRFFMLVDDMGSISGTVTTQAVPLAGATVWVEDTVFSTTSAADGSYSLPLVPVGAQTVSATKHGYNLVSHNVTVVEDQNTVQNFSLDLLDNVTVTGRVVGSDHPNIGLEGATIYLSGYQPYQAETNAQGMFTIPNVFSNQTYQYLVDAEGYQQTAGEVEVGAVDLNMGDVIVNEIAFPPSQVIAEENVAQTQVSLIWNSPTATPPFDDFEMDDGGWIPTASWDPVGDWEWTNTYDVSNFVDSYGSTSVIPPPNAYSGTGMWGTKINTNYTNSGGSNYLSKTFNFSGISNPELRFWSWENVFGDFDYCQVNVNGSLVWGPSWDYTNTQWQERVIDLTAFAGQSNVEITFEMYATTVVNYAGWYIDDVYVGMAQTREVTSLPASVPSWQIGLSELDAAKIADQIVRPQPIKQRTAQYAQRTMDGYKVWRLLSGDEESENTWTLLTPSAITDSTFVDTAWQPLPSGIYKYAVKAVYTNDVVSTPAFSNVIHKGMMGTLTGMVTEFGTDLPVSGATITAGDYHGTSIADGSYSFLVYQGTYDVTCSKVGYQSSTQTGVVMVGMQTTTQNFVLTEITLPPGGVVAEEVVNDVNITWQPPGAGGDGDWLHYDSGSSNNSIGTGGAADFDVAIRFPASVMADYAGQSLHAVKAWPAQAGTFSIRVWTGGTAAAPAQQVVDQPFTPSLDTYNTVVLSSPVSITGTEELWFGYRCNVTEGYPAGCDAGPAVNGFGNMMYFQGAWSTLIELADLNYNWCIQGYVGYGAPSSAPMITMSDVSYHNDDNAPRLSFGALQESGVRRSSSPYVQIDNTDHNASRALLGYKVWRLIQGYEGSEASWISLTADPISATAYQDNQWSTLEDGTYKWAVKAIYTGGAASPAAFSNAVPRITQIGTIAGIVRNQQNAPVGGATITCGAATATTNPSGAYSMQVIAGTHSVTASHPNYASVTHDNVTVITNQTTTVNFILPPSQVIFEDSFETYANFAIQFAPWTLVDVDQSATYGITNTNWDNAYQPQAYIIFVPSATTPPVANADPHTGIKYAACFAATTTANNDWLITPQFTGVDELKFWARSYTAQYGLERFKVGVSTTGTNPADFTIISGDGYVSAPDTWTEYTYPLGSYADTPVYIGLNCVSDDAFFFMVDDFKITGGTDADDNDIPALTTALNANFPNPFNPETTITYSLREASPVTIEIYNIKGQLVKTLVNDAKAAGTYTVVWNGMDNSNRTVSSGVYYYKMHAGKYSSTRKMILMK